MGGAKSVLKLLKSRSKREKLTPAARAERSSVSGDAAAAPAPGGLRRQRTEAAHKIAASVSRVCVLQRTVHKREGTCHACDNHRCSDSICTLLCSERSAPAEGKQAGSAMLT